MATSPLSALRLRGALWLLVLAPLFFITYGQVNTFTATRADVGQLAFGWEKYIPFLPWTIVPYWSIDLLYGISLFICTSRPELFRHGLRLLAASLVACAGFLLFPLRFSWHRPEAEGLAGWLFAQLEQFDLPYNQAPSLHIILTWLLWLRFRSHLSGLTRRAAAAWFLLIAVSVLTTWQHHFIDVISGLVAGVMISYLIPIGADWSWQKYHYPAKRIACRYAAGAMALLMLVYWLPGSGILIWPAVSLLLVALGYLGAGAAIWQKGRSGRMSLSARLVLLPVLLMASAIRKLFCRNLSAADQISDGVWIGYFPDAPIRQPAVLDLTAEFPAATQWTHKARLVCFPLLDLKTPELHQLQQGVQWLDRLHQQYGEVLVHCALGLSRSALMVAGWLLLRNEKMSVSQAVESVKQARSGVILTPHHLELLQRYRETLHEEHRHNQPAVRLPAGVLAMSGAAYVTTADAHSDLSH